MEESVGYLCSDNMWEAEDGDGLATTAYSCTYSSEDGNVKVKVESDIASNNFREQSEYNISSNQFDSEGQLQRTLNPTGKGLYMCDFCGKELTRKAYLVRHLKQHTGQHGHKCSLCEKVYAQRSNLTRHLRNVHKIEAGEMSSRTDDYSNRMCDDELVLPQYEEEEKPGSQITSMECREDFVLPPYERGDNSGSQITSTESREELVLPPLYERGEEKSEFIKYGFDEEFTEEADDKSEFDKYVCDMLCMEEEDKFEFDLSSIGEKIQLDYGLKSTHNPVKVECGQTSCNNLDTKYTEEFMLLPVKEEKEKSQCDIINVQHKNPFTTLTKHIKERDNTKQHKTFYTCDICGKKLRTKSTLKVHMKIHSYEEHHKCPFCDKSFTQKCSLGRHMKKVHRVELGDMPSSAGSTTKSDYLNGEYGSSNEELVLNMDYLGRGDLIAEGSRRFHKCPLCGKELSTKAILNGHIRRHIDGHVYKCILCDKTYADKASLKRHVKSVHNSTLSDDILASYIAEQDEEYSCSKESVLPGEEEESFEFAFKQGDDDEHNMQFDETISNKQCKGDNSDHHLENRCASDTQVGWENWWNNAGFMESIAF